MNTQQLGRIKISLKVNKFLPRDSFLPALTLPFSYSYSTKSCTTCKSGYGSQLLSIPSRYADISPSFHGTGKQAFFYFYWGFGQWHFHFC